MMFLSSKQMALFGRVKVNTMPVDSNIIKCVTLLELYKNGWWATERFGTIIALVKPRCYSKDGFSSLMRRISTDVNLDALDREIKAIAEFKYEKYKNKLDENRIKYKRLKKVDYDSDLSVLRKRNRSTDILLPTQTTNTRTVSKK